jgi:hypothetical protein
MSLTGEKPSPRLKLLPLRDNLRSVLIAPPSPIGPQFA